MNKNIQDYVLNANSILSPELCKKLIKEIEKNKKNWKTHQWQNRKNYKTVDLKNKDELSNLFFESEASKEVMKLLWNVIYGYVKKFNFEWFNSWTGYSDIRFNIYKKNKKMANHCDHIASIFDGQRKGIPILSVLGVLNDDYKGGEFIMFDDMEYEMKQGNILIFPSNFLYPHRVEPVKKGTRYSFISWVW
jgi:hypothetical protein